MREEKEYTIEEIILAAQKKKEYKATGDVSKRISFHTKKHTKIKLEDAPKVQRLIDFIEHKYKVKLKIVGGGYGCLKINFKVEGNDEAIDLAKKIMKDILIDDELKEVAKEFDLDVIVVPDKSQIFKVNSKTSGDPNPGANSDGSRVSADGSTQRTGS
ncbi:TPA: hypothetical protein ACPJ01_004463 [Vibrio diabolicus]